jgi:6-phosphofructokinase 1
MHGNRDGSVAIKRTGSYAVDYQLLPLETVAGKTRVMEDEFIAAGFGVTDPRQARYSLTLRKQF